MLRLVLAACVAVLACAQSPTDVFDKAPPQVEKNLRERIDKFFAPHVSGRFRQAEEVIHEDSRDIFYDSRKTKILSWDTVKITWSDNFTRAVVITNVEMDWYTPRMGKLRVKPPMKTTWKLDQGQWWWYAVQQKNWETPFGTMNPGADPEPGVSGVTSRQWSVKDVSEVLKQVVVSKQELWLKGYEPSQETIEVTNKMQGNINLSVEKSILPPGMDVSLSASRIGAGQVAKLTFIYDPPDTRIKGDAYAEIRVLETGQLYKVRLRFLAPPEIEKNLVRTK